MALKIFRLPELWNRKDRLGLWRAGKRKSARTISFATQLSPLCLAPM